jgi:hypothetical protein
MLLSIKKMASTGGHFISMRNGVSKFFHILASLLGKVAMLEDGLTYCSGF